MREDDKRRWKRERDIGDKESLIEVFEEREGG
jgi:hypothetical protein